MGNGAGGGPNLEPRLMTEVWWGSCPGATLTLCIVTGLWTNEIESQGLHIYTRRGSGVEVLELTRDIEYLHSIWNHKRTGPQDL